MVSRNSNLLFGVLIGLVAVLATIILYNNINHNNKTPTSSFKKESPNPNRSLRLALDPKTIQSKLFGTDEVQYVMQHSHNVDDINIWGHPAALTSFNYKWTDDQCPISSASGVNYFGGGEDNNNPSMTMKKKKRIALCLYGGVSSLLGHFSGTNDGTVDDLGDQTELGRMAQWMAFLQNNVQPNTPSMINTDWVAAMYDANIFPQEYEEEDEIELDLFIHSWSEEQYCTLAKSFDNTRFTVRSIIAESNERHMNELVPLVMDAVPLKDKKAPKDKQISMYFSMNKALALALDYSSKCEFEYDVLFTARPDVVLGEPFIFKKDGQPTSMYEVATEPNVAIYPTALNAHQKPDFHYIFNSNTARIFVQRMFPPPSEGYTELSKLTKQIKWHTGFVQEFAENNGIVMKPDGLVTVGKDEEVMRKIGEANDGSWQSEMWPYWAQTFDRLGVPKDCFPSQTRGVGWGGAPECHPTYQDLNSCPPNQNYISIEDEGARVAASGK